MVRADTGGSGARSHQRLAVLQRQLPFAAVVLVTAFGALSLAPEQFENEWLVIAGGTTLLATLLAGGVPWRLLPAWAPAAIPLLDMVAIVFAELGDFRAGPLVILPVLTLARSGAKAVTLAIVSGIAVCWAPVLLEAQPFQLTDDVADLVLRPTVVVAVALTRHVGERRSTAQRQLLAGQGAVVEELLTDARADRQLTQAVLNTIDTEVMVLDGAGAVRDANRAAIVSFGRRIAPGTPVAELVRPVLAADARTPVPVEQTPLIRASRGERIDQEVVWVDSRLGGRRAYRVSAAPLRAESGAATGAVLAMDDLTLELEALAKREEFVSSVSHELRTPLTSVTGYLELAMEDPTLDVATRLQLSVAARNAGRLEILIANLLAAARDGVAPPATRVDLAAIVRDVVEDQAPRADDAQVTVGLSAPATCLVTGDRTRLTQVVDNLVSNAIKYSTTGGEVAVTLTADDDGSVRLLVQDDGVGIDAADLPHVFDRFYRARAARDSTVQGTGLGLPITRQIVEDLGGTIVLDSAPGQGTRVDVALPAGGAA